jgi:hypothetical protein
MACHLAGGICPHDYPGSSRNGYLGGQSSSYGGGGNYAGLMIYNPFSKMSAQYNGSGKGSAGYNSLLVGNPLAAYATNPKYDAAYTAAGNYASLGSAKNNATSVGKRKEKQFIASDTARPAPTLDDTVDEKNVVAVQRNFLEQMIKNARQLTNAQRQPAYMVMYQ